MAARRRSGVSTAGRGSDIVVVNAAAPPARRSGGAIRRRRSSGRRRGRRGRGKGGAGNIQSQMQAVGLGGLAYGLLVKHVPDLPKIPAIGRSGTVALAVYFLKPSSSILRNLGIAAAAIAGYSFGESGKVSGAGDEDVLLSEG